MLRSWIIYACALLLGASLMSFEIVASRYLTPYFGSGINTWASLIALVLFGMTVGYFVGGLLVDRFPSLTLAAIFAGIAGLWFAAVPSVSPVFRFTRCATIVVVPISTATAMFRPVVLPAETSVISESAPR